MNLMEKQYSMNRGVSRSNFLSILALGLALSSASRQVSAEAFALDESQSLISLSGSLIGYPISEQGSGSLTTHYTGTINVDATPTNIQFTGNSLLDARTNGVWEPLPGGGQGTAPADYGAQASSSFPPLTAKAALRNLLLDVVSGTLPLNGTNFDASTLVFIFPSNSTASLDYRVTGFLSYSASQPLAGYSTNAATSAGSLVTSGDKQTLRIPISVTLTFTLVSPNDSFLTLNGEFVATRTIDVRPEFTSIAVTSGVVTLQWEGVAGQAYTLQSSTNLQTWTVCATNLVYSGAPYIWTTNTTGRREFFLLTQ